MKKYYLNPELEVIEFEISDVIVTSEISEESDAKHEQIEGIPQPPLGMTL